MLSNNFFPREKSAINQFLMSKYNQSNFIYSTLLSKFTLFEINELKRI